MIINVHTATAVRSQTSCFVYLSIFDSIFRLFGELFIIIRVPTALAVLQESPSLAC